MEEGDQNLVIAQLEDENFKIMEYKQNQVIAQLEDSNSEDNGNSKDNGDSADDGDSLDNSNSMDEYESTDDGNSQNKYDNMDDDELDREMAELKDDIQELDEKTLLAEWRLKQAKERILLLAIIKAEMNRFGKPSIPQQSCITNI